MGTGNQVSSYMERVMVDKKKNVLWITPFFSPNIGGVESHLTDLWEILTEKNYGITVLTYQPLTNNAKGLGKEVINNSRIYRYQWFGKNLFHKLEKHPLLEFLYVTPYLLVRSFLFLLLHHSEIDVIHAHGLNAAFITRVVNKFFRKRMVMSTYAIYNFSPRTIFSRIVSWTLGPFDKILSLTEQSKKELLRIGVPAHKITPYYLWTDQDSYRPLPKKTAREKTGLPEGFVVLFVGRYIAAKGVGMLLELASEVGQVRFVLIGDDGPLLNRVREAAKVNNNLEIIEGVRGAELIPYYQAADLLIVPSIHPEAFGKVAIEAFSCGTPVLASDAGALSDVVAPTVGKTGAPTMEYFKRELEFFYTNPGAVNKITANARAYAEKYFSNKNALTIEESYSEAAPPLRHEAPEWETA